jgi:hypothetical protein
MTDAEKPMFSDAFADAMKRIEAKRLMPEKQKLLRRSALMRRGVPGTSFATFNFLGWLHTKATGFAS